MNLLDSAAELELVLGQVVVFLHEAEQRPRMAELVLGDAGHRREIGQLAAVQHAHRVPVPQHPVAVRHAEQLRFHRVVVHFQSYASGSLRSHFIQPKP